MLDRLRSFAAMTAVAVASAGAFWLLRDHWGHMLGVAPYLLFLSCPLMHLFMRHGSRPSGGQPGDREPTTGAKR